MKDPYNHDACLKSYRAIEAERDALKAEAQIQHNFYMVAIEQRDALITEIEKVKAHHRFDLSRFRKCQDKLEIAREALEEIRSIEASSIDWDGYMILRQARDTAKDALARMDPK